MTWQELCEAKPQPHDKLVILEQDFIILSIRRDMAGSFLEFETVKEEDWQDYIKHYQFSKVGGEYKTLAEIEDIQWPERRTVIFDNDSFSQMELLKETTLVKRKKWMKGTKQ